MQDALRCVSKQEAVAEPGPSSSPRLRGGRLSRRAHATGVEVAYTVMRAPSSGRGRRACPHPNPPAEVGCFRLRPVNKWPNSGKPEFGCKRGREPTECAAPLWIKPDRTCSEPEYRLSLGPCARC